MALMLLTGVAGPLIDTFFLGGNLKRQEIIATKAVCQIVSHGAKLVYFGGIAAEVSTADPLIAALVVAASMIGTIAARPILERLTELQYRKWANHMITAIAVVYLARGSFLLLGG